MKLTISAPINPAFFLRDETRQLAGLTREAATLIEGLTQPELASLAKGQSIRKLLKGDVTVEVFP